MKIAVWLDDVPKMLRGIVLEALRREPGIEVIEAAGAPRFAVDALIVGRHPAPEAALRQQLAKRLIEIDPDGQHATVHTLQHASWRVDDPSPSRLVALLRDRWPDAPSEPRGLLRRVRRALLPARPPAALGATPALALPVAAAPTVAQGDAPPRAPRAAQHDAITLELARLAARLLAARAPLQADCAPQAELVVLAQELAAAAADAAGGDGLPGVARAAQCFGLRDDECELLLLAALVEADPRAARLVALLNDHLSRPRPTVGLVQDLGGELGEVLARLITPGPLLRLQLVALDGDGPLVTRSVKAADAVWPLLLGLHRDAPFERVALAPERLANLALPAPLHAACARAAAVAAQRPASRLLVLVVGDAGVGRQAMAEAIAAHWRDTAIVVPGASIVDPATIGALSREALWAHAAVIVTQAESMPAELWRRLTEALDAPLLATAEGAALPSLALQAARPLIEVSAPRRDAAQRLALWQAKAPAAWAPQALHELAQRYDFGEQQIASALTLAASRAEVNGQPAIAAADAHAACETLRETRFAGTAERMACPFESGDIVLRAETRRELDLAIAWARHASRVFGPAGDGAALRVGGGLACLFSGPPGGGKTMAAQIMARQIDYALFRVDLSRVVDKFIGESEKKLAALFDEAERARVALFFDEADALFGKRTEVHDSHDHYANITVDYLLQRIDTFSGLAILATNFASNIDDAFLRRMRVRANFAAPDAADRRRIWDKLLPAIGSRAHDIDIARLAEPFELVGGEIRNAIYTAHLLAAEDGGTLAMRHCVIGLWRELGKTGRITNLSQLGPWRSVVPV